MTNVLTTLFRIDGQTAVITGAARGIGRASAELLSIAGANVVIADINGEGASNVADAITANGHRALGVSVDISDESSVQVMFEAAKSRFGDINILIHCAAIFPKFPLLEITVDDWDRIQAVNLRGTMLVNREAIRRMQAIGKGGVIVNVSSVSGEREVVFHNAAYSASKAGMTNLTRVGALEFGGDGIRVNAVLPGGVTTEGARAATASMMQAGYELKGPMTQPQRIPLGRMGDPLDIAAACLFLASPAAKCITGQTLVVDGGFLVS